MLQPKTNKVKPVSIINKERAESALVHQRDWMASPRYNKMLKRSVKDDTEHVKIKEGRLKALTNAEFDPNTHELPYGASGEAYPEGLIRLSPKGVEDQSTYDHELSHVTDTSRQSDGDIATYIPEKDIKRMSRLQRKNTPKNERTEYLSDPSEIRARINSIRADAKDQGIYDPFKEKMTEEQYIQTATKGDASPILDLEELYTRKKALKLINSVSDTGTIEKDTDMNNKIIRPSGIGGRKGKVGYTGGTTEVVKAMSGAQIMGAAAAPAAFIPVVGPIASAVLAGGSAIWGASDAKKAKRKAAQEAQQQADMTSYNALIGQQKVEADQYNALNRVDLPSFAGGGDMNSDVRMSNTPSSTGKLEAVGGDLLPISDNAEVVSGNTHKENKIDGSYGVTLSANGKPIANVEDKEVIVDNNLVFSDKLKKGNYTFADIALGNNTRIGLLQGKLKSAKSNAEKFSIQRTIQGLEKANQDLFNEQQVVKSNTIGDQEETVKVTDGIVPKGAKGLKLYNDPLASVSELKPITYKPQLPTTTMKGINTNTSGSYEKDLDGIGSEKDTTIERLAPMLVDNVVNGILTSKEPPVVRPSYRQAGIVDTKVNVNPQIASITKAVNNSVAGIRSNTSNSAIARANMTAANLRGSELTNEVYSKKEEAERGLKNQQAQIVANNNNVNAQLQDEYKDVVRQAKLDKKASISRNVGNAIEDYKAVKETQLTDKYNQDVVNLSLLDDPTGEKMRRFKRLGKNLSDKDKVMLLKDIQRKKN